MKPAKRADWKTEELPAERITIPLDRTFNADEVAVIRRGFVPEQMEDKWFIFWNRRKLYFHRSWTGICM